MASKQCLLFLVLFLFNDHRFQKNLMHKVEIYQRNLRKHTYIVSKVNIDNEIRAKK